MDGSRAVSATMRLRLALEGAAEALAHAQVEGLLASEGALEFALAELPPMAAQAHPSCHRPSNGDSRDREGNRIARRSLIRVQPRKIRIRRHGACLVITLTTLCGVDCTRQPWRRSARPRL